MNNKKQLLLDDVNFLYQYLKFNFKKIKKYRNLTILFGNNIEKKNLFSFIESIKPDYLKKSNIVYISNNNNINKNLFDDDFIKLFNMEFSEYFIQYLGIYVSVNKARQKIDSLLKGLFMKNAIYIRIYFITAFILVYLIGNGILHNGVNIKTDTTILEYIYNYNVLIQLFFLLIVIFILFSKMLNHFYFYNYYFSKLYVLIDYKIYLYFILLKNLFIKKNHDIEIGFLNIKDEYFNYSKTLKYFISNEDLLNYQIFISGYGKGFNSSNFLLSQELVLDYNLLQEYQKKNNKGKLVLFNDTYNFIEELLKDMNFEFITEFEKLKSFFGLLLIYIYIYIILLIILILVPVLLSVL